MYIAEKQYKELAVYVLKIVCKYSVFVHKACITVTIFNQCKQVYSIIIILSFIIIVEFLTHPDNITVVHGTEVEFSCVVVDSDLLSFFVNGTAASNQNDKGFIQIGTEDIDATTTRRNLTATALTQYNNTEIQCAAFDIGNAKQQLSDIGILLVQGKLSLRPSHYTNVIYSYRSIIISC